ncbi:hypothetical protein HMPREF0239_02125 [Clostridium sp. ATCC BAA-442]|nr:hypothetical protein HMPREF0239_02125 [Clostridium sp. ATCC BAA-442]
MEKLARRCFDIVPQFPAPVNGKGCFCPPIWAFFLQNQLRALLFYGIICGRAFNDRDRFRNKLRGAPLCKIRS